MKVQNKWTGKLYEVISMKENEVTLQREDGTQFTIAKSEYFFSYFERK